MLLLFKIIFHLLQKYAFYLFAAPEAEAAAVRKSEEAASGREQVHCGGHGAHGVPQSQGRR
jgi:hypothetical protein